jgi:hypothetical protein
VSLSTTLSEKYACSCSLDFSFSLLFYVFALMVDWCGMRWLFEKFIEFFKWAFLFWWMVSLGSEKMVFKKR